MDTKFKRDLRQGYVEPFPRLREIGSDDSYEHDFTGMGNCVDMLTRGQPDSKVILSFRSNQKAKEPPTAIINSLLENRTFEMAKKNQRKMARNVGISTQKNLD